MKSHRLVGPSGMCALIVFAIALTGCGGSKPTSGVKGKVTYKGEAVADATVQIQSPATGTAGTAKTNAAGAYTIETPVPPGKYVVTVAPFEVPPPAPAPPNYKPADNPKIPKKYRIPTTSGLTFEAKAGANEFNIPMVD
ncbi:MAG: carboxypeptidase regulatory-like protein [Planctomycetaceae bacterium]|nr:carboxypeptidase regulatory-like protein [Planctomycetaceae bacterium]